MIYLDYNASTPIDPAVRDAMLPYLSTLYGNPSSGHSMGRSVKTTVEKARKQVAGLIGASSDEVIFTSGGTEASNNVIKGVARALRNRGPPTPVMTWDFHQPGRVLVCGPIEIKYWSDQEWGRRIRYGVVGCERRSRRLDALGCQLEERVSGSH